MLLNAGLSYNFGVLPVPVLERTNLSTNARLVLAVLDGFGQNAIFPHLPTIARRCGWAETSTKTVIAALVELVRGGFCDVKAGRGAHAPNYYFLKLPLYCRVEDPSLAEQIKAVAFPVNQMAWAPAIPGGGAIPSGHCQLSDGRVVPVDDVPGLAPAAAAAAGLAGVADPAAVPAQVGAHLEAAIAAAVAAVGGTPGALALGQRLAALVAATCDMHKPGGPAANMAPNGAQAAQEAQFAGNLAPAPAAGQAQGAGAGVALQETAPPAVAVDASKKVFFAPEGPDLFAGLSHNETSTMGGQPSTPAAAGAGDVSAGVAGLNNTANRVGQHGLMEQTHKRSNEREKNLGLPSLRFAPENFEAWAAWPATWAKHNPGKEWTWTRANLQVAERITAAAGVEALAGTLAAFAGHGYWSKNGLPLEALAKYLHEYKPAAAAAAPAKPAAPPACKHAGAQLSEFVNADEIKLVSACPCGHVETTVTTRAEAVFAVSALRSTFAAEQLAKMDAAAQGQAPAPAAALA